MRIFVAGASGVIGTRLVPLLANKGHQVFGMTRSPGKADLLRSLGAEPVVCDVFDAGALREALRSTRPEIIIDQLTDLPDDVTLIREGAANNRIRREGTTNILAAARQTGVARILVQSVAWEIPGDGGSAVREMERMVLDAGGVVLRYGMFYGPRTYYTGERPSPPRVHIDEAARLTIAALHATSGIITITDPD